MDASQFRTLIVQPILEYLDLENLSLENLLMGTCAQETSMLHYLKQIPNGPALGPYGMEPNTHNDIIDNFLVYRSPLKSKIFDLLSTYEMGKTLSDALISNLFYATAMATMQYHRCKETLPNPNDVTALANYWKIHYNTIDGAGTTSEFISNYGIYVK